MESAHITVSVNGLGKYYDKNYVGKTTLREEIYEALNLRKKALDEVKGFWALRNINFEVHSNEVLGIIGANGAGKSTLLKLLAEVTEPTEGSIEFNGKVASILEVGTGFHPDLTGIENIYLSGSMLGMSKAQIEERLPEIASFCELGDFLLQQVKYYSSGMFLRLAFSLCTHLDADILLFDEVIAVGDAAFSVKSLNKMRAIARSGRTVIIASHDLQSVQHICDRCILLEKGELADIGDTDLLIEKYVEQGIAKILSANAPQNYLGKKELLKASVNNGHAVNDWLRSEKIFETEEGLSTDGAVNLKTAKVLADQNTAFEISMKDEVGVEIEFEKIKPGPVVISIIIVYNLHTSVLSAAQFNNSAGETEDFNAAQYYRCRCNFPASFFNHGIFSVGIFITNENKEVIFSMDNVLIFKVAHEKLSKGALQYEGKFNGPLYPSLNWSFEQLGSIVS